MADNIEEIRARKKALRKAQRGKTVFSDERRKEESRKVAQRLVECINNLQVKKSHEKGSNDPQLENSSSVVHSQVEDLRNCQLLIVNCQFESLRLSMLVFFPLPDEPDLRLLYSRWQAKGLRLYLPRMVGDDLEVCRYDSDEDLREGPFHVLEPTGKAIGKEELESIDVILVPGMLFDKEGRRLGRGKGYYDRLLATMKGKAHTIGVCYESQVVDELPVEEHDIRVEKVLWTFSN